jgi:catechol 2,3-dioxygenase-like lactoylglutathione lyase family enzyme
MAHVGISVSDIERAMDWYRDNFGFTLVKQFEKPQLQIKGAVMVQGDCTLEILQPDKGEKAATSHDSLTGELGRIGANHLAITVDNIKALYEKIQAGNNHLVTDLWDQRLFFCKDPDGTLIEVKQEG